MTDLTPTRQRLGLSNSRTFFFESFARVQHLSLTGEILRHGIVDRFFVRWRSLQAIYPQAEVLQI